MNRYALFTDGSLHPKLRSGVGGFLIVPLTSLRDDQEGLTKSDVAHRIVLRRFEDTSSTELEIRTVLWALEEYQKENKTASRDLRIFTDSQCLAGLLKRRPGLEDRGFISRRTNRPLKNASHYFRFFQLYDQLDFTIVKVAGHAPSNFQDRIHRVFSWVDREIRKALNHGLCGEEGPGRIHLPGNEPL
ncbi:MAG: RNase H family protein [Thermodesulfobacteriota bacterium]